MNDALPDTIELTVEDVAYRGKGLARHEGCVVWLPGTLPGEKVRARIARRHRNFAEAEGVEILEPSPHRVAPACPLAGVCPGCAYQHADYGEELRLKQRQLANLFERLAGVPAAPLREPVPSPAALGYRNRIVLHAAGEGAERRLGYVGEDNRTVIDIPACPLALPPINAQLGRLRADAAFLAALAPGARVTIRHTPADGTLTWVGRAPGDAWLTEATAIGDLQAPRGSFFQVNAAVADRLVGALMEALAEAKPELALDLYSGVGILALAAARAGVPRVVGVDSDPAAIRAAAANAQRLGLPAAAFSAVPAAAGLRAARVPPPPAAWAAILDPPRTGLDRAVVEHLAARRPPHVFYVSCAADTMARDVKALGKAGYRVLSSQLFDMFPRTPYFESLTHLVR